VLTTIGGACFLDVKGIVDELKKMKDELYRISIKNHNMKSNYTSVILLLVANIVCVMLMFVVIILFMSI
jgi:hypothetical protein